MFKELTALSRDQHRGLRFNPRQPYSFAAGLMAAPIVSGEATLIAREYPIVFSRSELMPLALLGVRKDRNAYVTASGDWPARYIPAHVRRYPFMLADSADNNAPQGKRAFTVMFDAAAPHLAGDQGSALFNEAGEATPTLVKIQEILMNMQRDSERTRRLVQQIAAADLLVERVLQATTKGGKALGLEGLRVVDSKKLAACSAETLQQLLASGALLLIYAHLISMSNLQDGPLRQAEDLAPALPAQGGDTLSFAGFGAGPSS